MPKITCIKYYTLHVKVRSILGILFIFSLLYPYHPSSPIALQPKILSWPTSSVLCVFLPLVHLLVYAEIKAILDNLRCVLVNYILS